MVHVAIMKKSWGLLPKILSGQKVVESRWLKNKSAPWGKIKVGEEIYFKNSGEMVSVRARVEKLLEFSELNTLKVRQILQEYGRLDGLTKEQIVLFGELFKGKKYCLLIFLKDVQKVEPFRISKKGFGLQSAWVVCGFYRVSECRAYCFAPE